MNVRFCDPKLKNFKTVISNNWKLRGGLLFWGSVLFWIGVYTYFYLLVLLFVTTPKEQTKLISQKIQFKMAKCV